MAAAPHNDPSKKGWKSILPSVEKKKLIMIGRPRELKSEHVICFRLVSLITGWKNDNDDSDNRPMIMKEIAVL